MATYVVTGVRKALAPNKMHRHIEGVCTDDGTYHSRRYVVDSIEAGHTWVTRAGDYEAAIEVIDSCPYPDCPARPYIRTNPDPTELDNLEDLPPC